MIIYTAIKLRFVEGTQIKMERMKLKKEGKHSM